MFKKDSKEVIDSLVALERSEVEKLEQTVNGGAAFSLTTPSGKTVEITKDMITVKRGQKTVHVEEIVPGVIEPSFGIGRIMYAIFEHNFKVREGDQQRTYFSLPPSVAPLKCSVLPLSSNPEFSSLVEQIAMSLREHDVSHKVDDSSGSIGKRYARTDEIAIPFGITVDFDSLKTPHSVTLRDRDSMEQVRVPVSEIAQVVRDLSLGKIRWDQDVKAKYPKFDQQESSKAG